MNPHFKHFCISVWLPSLKMTTTSWKASFHSRPVVDVSLILFDSCLRFSFQLEIKTNHKHNSTQHNTQYSDYVICMTVRIFDNWCVCYIVVHRCIGATCICVCWSKCVPMLRMTFEVFAGQLKQIHSKLTLKELQRLKSHFWNCFIEEFFK